MKKTRYKLQQAIDEVLNSDLYGSGRPFSVGQMFEICETIGYESRMSEVLRNMHENGMVTPIGSNVNLLYRKPGKSLLRKAFISEVAQNLCAGDYERIEPGQARRDAIIRARALEAASEAACGDRV